MNRRDIMKLFGLGAAVAAAPAAAPVAATPAATVTPHPLHHMFLDPLDVEVYMRGGKVYTVRAHRHPDTQSVRVSIFAPTSGVVMRMVVKQRGGAELITVYQGGMDTPFVTLGATVNIDIEGRPL